MVLTKEDVAERRGFRALYAQEVRELCDSHEELRAAVEVLKQANVELSSKLHALQDERRKANG